MTDVIRASCWGILLFGLSCTACSHTDFSPPPPNVSRSGPLQSAPLIPPYSLAILPFENLTDQSALAWLRTGFMEMLTTDLAAFSTLDVISRQTLGEVLREQWLQYRGLSPDMPAVRLGQLTGARYLVKGSYYLDRGNLVLEVHLIDSEHGTVVRSARLRSTLENIPELGKELAEQVGRWFVSEGKGDGIPLLGQLGVDARDDTRRESSTDPPDHTRERIPPQAASQALSHSTVLRSDSFLYLERMQRLREAAVLVADLVWTHGFRATIMTTEFRQSVTDSGQASSAPVLHIPFTVEFQRYYLEAAPARIERMVLATEGPSHRLRLAWRGDDPVARTLFQERLGEPRRLFVRARDSAGTVVAVLSAWRWRMEQLAQVEGHGIVSLPVGSVLIDEARMPVRVLAQSGKDLSFDAVIVRVPSERRVVVIEPVEAQDEPLRSSERVRETMMTALETWVRTQWTPTVWESVPVAGYLPSNRRSAVLLVSGTDGTIREVRIIRPFAEPLLDRDLPSIQKQLVGTCLVRRCLEAAQTTDEPFAFRVHLELLKDVRAVGLGGAPGDEFPRLSD